MVDLDLVLSIGIWASGVGTSWIGIEMTINPPTAKTKWWYRGSFILLGVLFVAFSIWQSSRQESEKHTEQTKHQEEEIRHEGETKYIQGQLQTMTSLLSATASGQNLISALAGLHIGPPPARKVTDAMRATIKRELHCQMGKDYGQVSNQTAGIPDICKGGAVALFPEDLESVNFAHDLNEALRVANFIPFFGSIHEDEQHNTRPFGITLYGTENDKRVAHLVDALKGIGFKPDEVKLQKDIRNPTIVVGKNQ